MDTNSPPLRLHLLLPVVLCGYLVLSGCNDAKSNIGNTTLPDSSVYHGEMQDDRFHGEGELIWRNGDRYQGQFANGFMQGRGTLIYASGHRYEGEFQYGLMHGQGIFSYANGTRYEGQFESDDFNGQGTLIMKSGDQYTGQFSNGTMEGQGIYVEKSGIRYEGQFIDDVFSGNGTSKHPRGDRYTGEFKNWLFHGQGRFETTEGDIYEGNFKEGTLEGEGIHQKKNGERYQGAFENWVYHGKGSITYPSGDRYEGQFEHGMRHGQGTLHLAKPLDGNQLLSGEWSYDRFVPQQEEEQNRRQARVESLLYNQERLLKGQFEQLDVQRPGQIDLYFLGIGGYGQQDVFLKEVDTIQELFDTQFDTRQRSMVLINSDTQPEEYPLATSTSIRRSLKTIAGKMNPEEDILFLYLTSHGSKKHRLSLSLDGLSIADLSAQQLAQLLNEVDIRWRVVMVSACYSGGFIDPLQNDQTLIITAAAKDKRSYGCSDENDMTDFARAYFLEALPQSSSFEEAYIKARSIIQDEEQERKVKEASEPQLAVGKAMSAYLTKWRSQVH